MAVKASVQCPFDKRIQSITLPGSSKSQKLARGRMRQASNMPGYSTPFFINFLYNPSTVEATYYVQSSGAALSMLFPNPGDASDLAVPINQQVNWTVMYDRTYELNDGAYDQSGNIVSGSQAMPTPAGTTADPSVYGVWADVAQFQFFTGMMLTATQGSGNAPSGVAVGNFAGSQGFMMMVPCYVYFGGGTQSNINYYGYISEWDVTYCLSEDTEILTKRGWLRYDQLTTSDACLGIEPESHEITWQPVQSVHTFPYDGELVHWKHSRGVDVLSTPNHRWITPEGEFVQTQEVSDSRKRILIGGGTPHCFAEQPIYEDELVELIGWTVTEGYYATDSNAVIVAQSPEVNPDKTERVRLLAKYFAEKGATTRERPGGGATHFYFGNGISKLIREVAPDKQLIPEFLCNLTQYQAELLYETLIDGDGCRSMPTTRFTQKDQGRINGFQMLCAMLGRRTCAKSHKGVDVQDVSVYSTTVTTGESLHDDRVQYKGVVWCPKTPTETWLARRNGSTFWTGNTHWTQWMVPMRAVIDISFTMLPPPAKKTSTTGSTGAGFAPTPSGIAPVAPFTSPR
jgi:hypothetical protein